MSFVEFSQQFVDIDEATDSEKYELTYIFLSPQIPALQKKFGEKGREVRFVRYTTKKDLPRAVSEIYKFLGELKPDIVHTHLVDASLAGLAAASLRNIKKRVHTRHHSIENYEYYPHAVRYDKIINRLSKKIIAISRVVSNVLTEREAVAPEKVVVINHGFNFENYSYSEEKVSELKKKYGTAENYPVIGVISRFVHWKGVQFIIPAFAKLLEQYPDAKLVLAGASGSYANEIKRLLNETIDESQFVLIEFEFNFKELFRMFDVFVHVPINPEFEAFGQTYIESLALEIPSVFTLSGIADDFVEDGKNAMVVDFMNSDEIYDSIIKFLTDKKLQSEITARAKAEVLEKFNIGRMIVRLDELYRAL